jgi:hypothetical protein
MTAAGPFGGRAAVFPMNSATLLPPAMNSISSRFTTVTHAPAPVAPGADAFRDHLSALYALSQKNSHVFGSPLGPFYYAGCPAWLPRFVFFGPHASDDSWRLAFLAGFDRRDLRASRAMLRLVERLAGNAEDGCGLNLSFFPLIDAAGFFLGAPPREPGTAHWTYSAAPEIDLLEKDARQRGYHGFIRIEPAAPADDVISIHVREPAGLVLSPDVELISSAETDPFPVRFERAVFGSTVTEGPLTVADGLSFQPFELTLRIPPAWPDEIHHEAVDSILTRFILRYRAFQAYGQHL